MVCPEFMKSVGVIDDTFADCAMVSGLHLNFQKVQVVPLWLEDISEVRRRLGNSVQMEHDKNRMCC